MGPVEIEQDESFKGDALPDRIAKQGNENGAATEMPDCQCGVRRTRDAAAQAPTPRVPAPASGYPVSPGGPNCGCRSLFRSPLFAGRLGYSPGTTERTRSQP